MFQRVARRHGSFIQVQSSQRMKTRMSMRRHGKLQTADELVHSMGLYGCVARDHARLDELRLGHIVVLFVVRGDSKMSINLGLHCSKDGLGGLREVSQVSLRELVLLAVHVCL